MQLRKNEYGFYQVANYPTDSELQKYYEEKYYQGESNTMYYKQQYTAEELCHTRERAELWLHIIKRCSSEKFNTMLDIGCGEGFSMKQFSMEGYNVTGVDYSNIGIKNQNEDMLPYFTQGNILEKCKDYEKDGKVFDIILMQNALEHVNNPIGLLRVCNSLLSKKGFLLIDVPNDFNPLQDLMVNEKLIKNRKWVGGDHLSYFNKEGLNNLLEVANFECKLNLCTELIELYGLNPDSNYYDIQEKGHNCHVARLKFDHLIHTISFEKAIDFYIALAQLDIGRNLLGVYQKK